MIRHAVALRYAKALFQIDKKKHAYKKRIKDFEYLFALFAKNPKVHEILKSPLFVPKTKEDLLKSACKEHVDTIFLQFLFYLLKKKRLNSINEIFTEYEILADIEDQVWEAKLISGVSLQKAPRQNLIEKLEKFYSKKVVVKEVVNPKIIGGTFLILGNKQLDWSIKTRMEKLEKHLLGLDICR